LTVDSVTIGSLTIFFQLVKRATESDLAAQAQQAIIGLRSCQQLQPNTILDTSIEYGA
jgi:hypothetical protein